MYSMYPLGSVDCQYLARTELAVVPFCALLGVSLICTAHPPVNDAVIRALADRVSAEARCRC